MTKSTEIETRDSTVTEADLSGREKIPRRIAQMSMAESGSIPIGNDQLPSRSSSKLRNSSSQEFGNKTKKKSSSTDILSESEPLESVTREKALVILQRKNLLKKQPKFVDHNSNSKDVYLDFPNKFDCPRIGTSTNDQQQQYNKYTTTGSVTTAEQVIDKLFTAPPLNEVIKALRGSHHRKPAQCEVEETSPLIHNNSSSSVAGPNSFDNVVAFSKRDSESSSESSNQSVIISGSTEALTTTTTINPTQSSDVRLSGTGISRPSRRFPTARNSNITSTVSSSSHVTTTTTNGNHSGSKSSNNHTDTETDSETATVRSNKKRNLLRIMIPREISAVNGVKQLSAAETRKMEEAIELANSFCRHEKTVSTPRTPGGGSISKESLSSSLDSPTQKWFNFKKKLAREEKKSFVDELNITLAASPNGLLTPEAQEAYNSLVAQNPPLGSPKKSPSEVALPEGCELSLPGKTPRRKRSSLSDSEKYPLPVQDYQRQILSGRHTIVSGANSLTAFKPVKETSERLRSNQMRAFHWRTHSSSIKPLHSSSDDHSASTLTEEAVSSISSNNATPVNTPSVDMSPISNPSQNTTPKNISPAVVSSTPIVEKVCHAGFIQRSMSMFERSCDDNETECLRSLPSELEKASRNSARPLLLSTEPEQSDNEFLTDGESHETELKITEPCDLPLEELVIEETNICSNSRLTCEDTQVLGENDYQNIIPPPLPPRIPLRKSTLNNPLPCRRYPLPSDPCLPDRQRTMSDMALPVKKRSFLRQASCYTGARSMDLTVNDLLNQSSSSSTSSTSGSEQLNISTGSEDNVFKTSDRRHLVNESEYGEVSGCFTGSRSMKSTGLLRRRVGGSIRDVKMNAKELGIHDTSDRFWAKHVTFDIPDYSQSEADLRRNSTSSSATGGVQGRCDASDGASYEDLMDFALEVEDKGRKREMTETLCEEIKLMRKVLSEDISVEDCMEALNETCWDLHSSIKLIKLKQLLSTNLADKQQCKQALMFCGWNIDEAAAYLLVPPEQRRTPGLVNSMDL